MDTEEACMHTDMTCDEARWQLCRLAAGAQLRRRALALARHVRGCSACDGFTDELARTRGRLSELARRPVPRPRRAELDERARAALARELSARLSRDLLALGQGRLPRPAAERGSDLRRLALTLGEPALRDGELAEIEAVLAGRRSIERGRALELACRLDPLGFDLALAWLGYLERHGDPVQAHGLAERLLADVP